MDKANEWISVEDKMPDEYTPVLGYMVDAGDYPSVRECYRVVNVFYFPALMDAAPISHWMPMPETPKVSYTKDIEPHDEWLYKSSYYEADECDCSLCGQMVTTAKGVRMNFCPNCGAKMDKEGENK